MDWASRHVLAWRLSNTMDTGFCIEALEPALRTGTPGANRVAMDLGLDVALALDADVLLQGHEGDARLGEGVEHGDDLTQRPAEPGEFADDQTVAGLQGVRQLVQRRRFSEACPEAVASMKSSMWRSCFRAYSRMARRWLLASCCGVETCR